MMYEQGSFMGFHVQMDRFPKGSCINLVHGQYKEPQPLWSVQFC